MIDFADFASLTDVQWRTSHEVERGIYIAEGTKTIARALETGHALRSVITTARWIPGLLAIGVPASAISEHSEQEMEGITGFHVHRGALAAFERPAPLALEPLLTAARRVVILEDIVEHANVGAILRSAAAFDIDAVLLSPACADPLYRRAVKVSMGSVFAVPWSRLPWPEGLGALHNAGFTSLSLTPADDAVDIRRLDAQTRAGRWALVLGTEGDGLQRRTMEHTKHRVRIAMSHGVDSLNVAAAAAVACFELTR